MRSVARFGPASGQAAVVNIRNSKRTSYVIRISFPHLRPHSETGLRNLAVRGVRNEANKRFVVNENPGIEHMKIRDFASESDRFQAPKPRFPQPVRVWIATAKKALGRHRNVFSGRLLVDPLESSVGGLCVF